MEECLSSSSLENLRAVLAMLRQRRDSGNYQWDADKEKRAKEAVERRKREEVRNNCFTINIISH